MKDFPAYLTEGIGGVQEFSFIPTHDVDNIPLYFGISLETSVVLKSGKEWFTGVAIPKTLQLTEKLTKNRTYQYTISGYISGADSDIMELFTDMEGRTFLIDITDKGGNRRLVGTINEGMRFSWEHDSKTSGADRNDFYFEFTGETPSFAPVYAPAEVLS